MVRLRKFSAYQNLKRPYTRISKFSKKNFVRGGYPQLKIARFEMGSPNRRFDLTLQLVSQRSMNIRQNALESARMTSNRLLEKSLGSNYFMKLLLYPFHVLRENPLAAGAGADRMSKGMQLAYGKPIGSAARVMSGQTIFELRLNKESLPLAREAFHRALKKLPCPCKIVVK